MGTLYFKVASDWEEVVKLRGEIEKLKDTLRGMNTNKAPSDVEALEKKLESATQKYRDLVAEAAKSGAILEQNIKKVTDSFKIDTSLDQLKVFDGELMKMCGNLDKYFDGVIGKIESMHSALQAGKIGIDDSSSSVPAHQLDDLRVKNVELTEQLSKQKDEIKQQQEEWNKLANAIKTNNVSAIDQYKQATGSSSDTIKSAKNELKGLTKELNENIEYYDKLATQIVSYKSILNRLYTAKEKGLTRVHIGDGATSLISSELERFKPQLDDATQKSKEISREIGVQKQRVSELNDVIEQGNQKHARTRTLIIDAREQLMQMRSAGLQNTAQYQQASEELGKMRKQMVLVNAEMDYLSNPNKNLAVFKAGLSGVASSASLVVGVMGLVNQKDEEMIMLQTKIQSLLGIIVGLEGSYNMIKKSSILMIAIENTQRKASIASQLLETKAKTTNIALTWSEVAAQKALNVVANANPYVLLATAMMTVVGGIWLLTKATGEAREQIEKFNKEVAETASTPIAKVEELSSKWNRLGNNLESKKKFVENNKKAFDELGIAILNVTDAENLLNNNKDAFIKAMIERAKATEYLKEQKENIAKLIKAEQEIEDAKNKTFRAFDSKTAEGLRELAVAAAQSNYDKIANSIKQGYTKAAQAESEGTKILNDARLKGIDDADNLMDDYTYKMTTGVERGNESFKRFAESVSKGYNSMLGSMSNDTLSFSQKTGNMLGTLFNLGDVDNSGALTIGQRTSMLRVDYAKALRSLKELRSSKSTATQKEIDDAQKEVNKIADIYKNITGKAIDDKSANKEVESLRKQQEKYKDILTKNTLEEIKLREDLQMQVDEARIKAMDEGSKKNIAEMELNFEKELQAIDRQKEDLLRKRISDARDEFEANPKNKGKTFDGSKRSLSDDDTKYFDGLYKAALDNWGKVQKDMKQAQTNAWNESLKEFGTYLEKRQAIQDLYADKISKTEMDGDKNTLNKRMQNELDELDNSVKNSATLMGQLFADASKKSVGEIQAIIDKAELLMRYLESIKDEDGNANIGGKSVSKKDILNLGISENTLQNLGLSVEEMGALKTAISKLKDELENKSPFQLFVSQIKTAANSIKQGGKKDIVQGITGIGDAIVQFTPALSQFGQDLGNIFGNDSIGDSIQKITDGLGGLGQTASGVGQIMSGDIVGGVMSAVSGISKIASLFGGESEEEKRQRYIEQLNQIVAIYDKIIDKQKESIKFGYGFSAIEAAKKAMEELNKQTEYYRKIAKESPTFLKQGVMPDYKKALKDLGVAINPQGMAFGLTSQLSDLTSTQLIYIRDNYKDLWGSLNNEQRDALQAIIDAEEKGKEIIDQWQEAITGISYDSFYDGFIDTLSDMDASAEDMAENFGEYLKKSILAAMVYKNFQKDIDDLYNQWTAAGDEKSDGGIDITEDEAKNLQDKYDDLVNRMTKMRDDMSKTYGWDSSSSSQSASSKGFQAMSQDTGEELNGRFTALQVAGEDIRRLNMDQIMSLKEFAARAGEILTVNSDIRNIADDTRNILASTYLETVEIKENTGLAAKYLKDIKTDIAEVKQNTSKL